LKFLKPHLTDKSHFAPVLAHLKTKEFQAYLPPYLLNRVKSKIGAWPIIILERGNHVLRNRLDAFAGAE
jgi:hypothetical protein